MAAYNSDKKKSCSHSKINVSKSVIIYQSRYQISSNFWDPLHACMHTVREMTIKFCTVIKLHVRKIYTGWTKNADARSVCGRQPCLITFCVVVELQSFSLFNLVLINAVFSKMLPNKHALTVAVIGALPSSEC